MMACDPAGLSGRRFRLVPVERLAMSCVKSERVKPTADTQSGEVWVQECITEPPRFQGSAA
jgi:hypothetical protein